MESKYKFDLNQSEALLEQRTKQLKEEIATLTQQLNRFDSLVLSLVCGGETAQALVLSLSSSIKVNFQNQSQEMESLKQVLSRHEARILSAPSRGLGSVVTRKEASLDGRQIEVDVLMSL